MKCPNKMSCGLFLLMGAINLLSFSCKEEIALPEVVTKPMLKISYSNVLLGGYIIPKEGCGITSKGICWSLDTLPTIDDYKKADDLATFGSFEIIVTGFILDTIYYFRAYAMNEAGIGYGEVMKFRTYWGTVTDVDGNIYTAVRIGKQIWMGQDLKVTRYRNNDPIPQINDNALWSNLNSGAYCSPNDFLHDVKSYGQLYNFYAVNDNRKIAPHGWHIPTIEEWEKLVRFLGGDAIAGGKLKEQGYDHWVYPNTGATNEYIFTALPGGDRRGNGTYQKYNYYVTWWSSSISGSSDIACSFELSYNNTRLVNSVNLFGSGLYIRCIKD